MLVWRGLEDEECGFLLCVWEDEDLRVVAVGRPEPRGMGFGRLRKNERRNQGWVAEGLKGDRPALARARSCNLRLASSFCL